MVKKLDIDFAHCTEMSNIWSWKNLNEINVKIECFKKNKWLFNEIKNAKIKHLKINGSSSN